MKPDDSKLYQSQAEVSLARRLSLFDAVLAWNSSVAIQPTAIFSSYGFLQRDYQPYYCEPMNESARFQVSQGLCCAVPQPPGCWCNLKTFSCLPCSAIDIGAKTEGLTCR